LAAASAASPTTRAATNISTAKTMTTANTTTNNNAPWTPLLVGLRDAVLRLAPLTEPPLLDAQQVQRDRERDREVESARVKLDAAIMRTAQLETYAKQAETRAAQLEAQGAQLATQLAEAEAERRLLRSRMLERS